MCYQSPIYPVLTATLTRKKKGGENKQHSNPPPPPLPRHLVLSHSAKVVVSEKDAKFTLLGSCGELTQSVVGQLGRGGLQELFCNQACQRAQSGGGALA